MGLDQYAYRVKRQNVIDDLKFKQGRLLSDGVTDELGNDIGFDYWRKFYPLNRWAGNLYVKKGGTNEFDCAVVRLDEDALDELYELAQDDEFYEDGYYHDAKREREAEYEHLMKFIRDAKEAITEGDAIYYSNWE